MAVAGWVLITSRDPSVPLTDWKVVQIAPTENACDAVRDTVASEATSRELGALSSLDAQNPVRVAAYEKAYRRVNERYRCIKE